MPPKSSRKRAAAVAKKAATAAKKETKTKKQTPKTKRAPNFDATEDKLFVARSRRLFPDKVSLIKAGIYSTF